MIKKIAEKVIKKIAQQRPIELTANFVECGSEFDGKTALVIGGGTGIGYAIAQELAANGAKVVVCGRKLHKIENMDAEVLDVSKIDELKAALQMLINKYGRFDIVVNSQGICPEADFKQSFYEIDQADFEKVSRVNFESVYFVNQFFCEYYENNKISGNILNICSTEGLKGNVVPYGLTKAAVISMTKGIGKIMASKNIVVNGIAPGATATAMMKMDCDGNIRKDYIPSKRATIPLEIAKGAHLLLSDAGRQMCGQILVIDGGESLK